MMINRLTVLSSLIILENLDCLSMITTMTVRSRNLNCLLPQSSTMRLFHDISFNRYARLFSSYNFAMEDNAVLDTNHFWCPRWLFLLDCSDVPYDSFTSQLNLQPSGFQLASDW